MTAKAVTNDLAKNQKPTSEQVDNYTRRENELRQRFLKGILDVAGVMDLLQKALELVKSFINCNVQPETPSWADQENPIIKHVPCGVIDPARLVAVDVFQDGESSLEGEVFMNRAQALDSMNACAFDFYAKPENWKYIPKDVEVLVFPQTEFRRSDGRRCVQCLCRRGSRWSRHYDWVGRRFNSSCRVAVLASSPKALETKTS